MTQVEAAPRTDGALSLPSGSWSMELQPWPYWAQMNDPAMDGDGGSGPNAANDCGPESVSMPIAHLTEVQLDADYIWDCIQFLRKQHGEPTGLGYTSIVDLTRYLSIFCGIDTDVIQVDISQPFHDASGAINPAPASLLWHVWKGLTLEHPAIGLFSFSAPDAPDGHFRDLVGMDNAHVITADPANGTRRVETYADFWAWSHGWLIKLRRRRSILP